MRRLVWLATAALVAAMAGCGGGGDDDSVPEEEETSRAAAGRQSVILGIGGAPMASSAAATAAVEAAGGRVTRTFKTLPYVVATVPSSRLEALRRQPGIRTLEVDGEFRALDTELDRAWGVKKIGAGTVHTDPVNPNKGAGTAVAVIDTGCNYNHSDLNDRFLSAPDKGYDFVNNDDDPMDDNGHGTHVCGTVAAEDNDDQTSVVGVAPMATLVALKVLNASGSGSFGAVMAALDWCIAENADGDGLVINVANCSFGSSVNPGTAVEDAFNRATAAGILCVAAAGNSGNRKGTGDNINYPARYAAVVAVGATDSSDNRASFSSTGPKLEVVAPGVSIRSTSRSGGYVSYSGTSMACPHVAGLAALVFADGAGDPATVRQRIADTCLDRGAVGRDSLYGYGRVQAVPAVNNY